MIKRCLFMILAIVECFTFSPAIAASAATYDKTNESFENLTYKIPVTEEYMKKVFGAPEEILSAEVGIISVCHLSSIPGGLLSVPEDILEGPTEELLNYFRETYDMWIGVHERACGSLSSCISDPNYYNNGAFCELITRADLRSAILKNMTDIRAGCYVDHSITDRYLTSADEQIKVEIGKLRRLVMHIPTEIIFSASNTDERAYENSSKSASATRAAQIY